MLQNPLSHGTTVINGSWEWKVRRKTIFHVHDDTTHCAVHMHKVDKAVVASCKHRTFANKVVLCKSFAISYFCHMNGVSGEDTVFFRSVCLSVCLSVCFSVCSPENGLSDQFCL